MAIVRVPALARLVAAFPSVDPENVRRAREILVSGGKLGAVNSLLAMHGVEYATGSQGIAFAYLNSGDTYAPTLARRTGSSSILLTTMGDEVERAERRGHKFD